MTSPHLSAVVVHHRGQEQLLEALAALERALSDLSAEILLVDNTDGAPMEGVLRRHPTLRRIAAAGNVGFAAGCRLGAEAARGNLLLFVNDDAVIEQDAAQWLSAALDGAPQDVIAAAGRLVDPTGEKNDFSDGFLTFDGHAFAADVGRPIAALPSRQPGEERLFACGGLMSVRRREFLDSGGFDDDYFAYLEDVDFGWRQWIFGRRIVAEPRAVARHRGGATGEALGIFSRGFLFEKNAFATAYKNFDDEHFRSLMPAILAAFLGRIGEMLSTRNPGAAELQRDPYREPDRSANALSKLFGFSRSAARPALLDDPLTIAHCRALLWIHANAESLARKRKAIQARRRRPDAEIFARFPLRLVPTYPGDQRFDSDFFRDFLAASPRLVRTSLAEIFG